MRETWVARKPCKSKKKGLLANYILNLDVPETASTAPQNYYTIYKCLACLFMTQHAYHFHILTLCSHGKANQGIC